MKLFRRNKTDPATMPEELQNYYQSEKRERTGVAWLLAFATVIVTVLVILALFYGGRWTYRKIRPPKKANVVSIQQENPTSESSENNNSPNSSSSNDTEDTPTTTQSQATSNSTPQSATTSGNSSATTGSTNASTDLPNTGPGDTLAIFAAVSVLAYVSHRRFLTKS